MDKARLLETLRYWDAFLHADREGQFADAELMGTGVTEARESILDALGLEPGYSISELDQALAEAREALWNLTEGDWADPLEALFG